jgi:predicted small secreted protein
MKKYIMIVVLAAFGLAMTGCRNTANGFGKDMENNGEKIQNKTQ